MKAVSKETGLPDLDLEPVVTRRGSNNFWQRAARERAASGVQEEIGGRRRAGPQEEYYELEKCH